MWAEPFDPNLTPGKINKLAESFFSLVANNGSGFLVAVFTFFFFFSFGAVLFIYLFLKLTYS